MINAAYISELKHESISTRKMLERIPMDQYGWKPHEKSMSLEQLTEHIMNLINWITITVNEDELDLSKDFGPRKKSVTNEDLLNTFNSNVEKAIEALESADNNKLQQPWTLRHGDHVIFTMPRVVVLRNFCFNHFIHHRGQLSVYLRMLNVSLPSIYGPSADER